MNLMNLKNVFKNIITISIVFNLLALWAIRVAFGQSLYQEIDKKVNLAIESMFFDILPKLNNSFISISIMPFDEIKSDTHLYNNNMDLKTQLFDTLQQQLLKQKEELGNKNIQLEVVEPLIIKKILENININTEEFFGRLFKLKPLIPSSHILTGRIYYYNEDIFIVMKLVQVETITAIWGESLCFSQWGKEKVQRISKSKCIDGINEKQVLSFIDLSDNDKASVFSNLISDIIQSAIAKEKQLVIGQEPTLEKIVKIFRFESNQQIETFAPPKLGGALKPDAFVLYNYRSDNKSSPVKIQLVNIDNTIVCVDTVGDKKLPLKHNLRIFIYPDIPEKLRIVTLKDGVRVNTNCQIDEDDNILNYYLEKGSYEFKFYKSDSLFADRFVILDQGKSLFVGKETSPWIIDVKKGIYPNCSERKSPSDSIGYRIADSYCLIKNGKNQQAKIVLDNVSSILRNKGCSDESLDPVMFYLFYLCQGKYFKRDNRYHVANEFFRRALLMQQKSFLSISNQFVEELNLERYDTLKEIYERNCSHENIKTDPKLCDFWNQVIQNYKIQYGDI